MDLRGALIELVRPGEGRVPGREMWRFGSILLATVIVVTNLVGATVVLVIALFVVPLPKPRHVGHVELINALLAVGYVAVVVPLGIAVGVRRMWRVRSWLRKGRQATLTEIRLVLHAPLRLFSMQLAFWSVAAVLFGVLDGTYSARLGVRVGITVLLTGLVTASCAYLLTERILRSPAARALAHGSPRRFAVPGVATRAVLAWALGTGVPLGGLVAIGSLALAHDSSVTVSNLGVAMVTLGAVGLAVGLLAVILAARTTADPISALRRGLASVQHGEFDVRVPVYDGSQIGQLQMGFNEMVAGLAERERIREAFGTYVDQEVAAHILDEGVDLAGEEVEVTLMFIDVRNFTGFAEQTPANEVVSAINQLFETIVPIIHRHGGRVDKFVGDGLLAVFGAPRRQPDHADEALAAALEVADVVGSDAAGPLEIGVGLNSGMVVAGNIGGDRRYEFSVIGDAVNVAARVEAATRQTGDTVLLTDRTAALLHRGQVELEKRPGLELRGKRDAVPVYAAKVRDRDASPTLP